MAFVAYSEDFDLDDDGILRDSTELEEEHWTDFVLETKPGGILIDDDGIVRDDLDILSKHGSSTHWTDSGLGVDKPSSTPSTLRQLDLQSYPSFEDVSRNLDDSNVNISDLEASRDDISFDEGDKELYGDRSRDYGKGNRSGLSSRSSFDHSLNYDDTLDNTKDEKRKEDLFSEEYYRQLQELGVLVDEEDFVKPRDSLQEFENLEDNYSRDYDDEDSKVDNAIEEFLRHEAHTPTRDIMDRTKPYEDNRTRRPAYFDESHGFDQFDGREFDGHEGGKRTRPNTASSTRTISSRSFPEISPEEAMELYTARLQSMDDQTEDSSIQFDQSQSQRLTQASDDEEIFFMPSQERDDESPKPPKMPAYDDEDRPSHTLKSRDNKDRSGRSSDRSRSVTPQGQGHSQGHRNEYDDDNDESRSLTPQPEDDLEPHGNMSRNGYHSNDDRADSLTQVTRLDSRNKTYSDSDTFRPDSALSELSSAASESRSARPKTGSNQGKRGQNEPPKGNLSHARSQESFFDMQDGSPKKTEKGPKRLLPKPSSSDGNQSFKVKSKSVTNISALGPLKPTHMSLSEIHNINIDDNELENIDPFSDQKSTNSDVPKGELTQKLKHESNRRQQATHLVKQLQSDYDKLLSKYALAELTIDQMRLGAKISIHANSPTPSQATSGSIQSAQHLHMLQLVGAQQAGQISASPQQTTPNLFFPENVTNSSVGTGQDANDGRMPRGMSPALLPRSDSTNSMDSTSTPRGDQEEQGGIANEAEKVKFGLLFQARNLEERMQSFQTLLGEQQLTVQEQENVFETIRNDHEKLRRDYLQSKEDYNVLKRSSAAIGSEVNFDQEKELEGELFKLGMKFDEIHEKVDENMKEKSSKRQPFQDKRKDSVSSGNSSTLEPDPSTENTKKKIHGVKAGDDLLQPRHPTGFEDKLKKLHEEYNGLMDRYRRLKQMGESRERDKEIDHLVKKLRKICQEEPDIFKLPPELQDRVDQMKASKEAKAELNPYGDSCSYSYNGAISKNKSGTLTEKRKLPSPKKASRSPAKSYEIMSALSGSESWSLAESIDRWERTKVMDQDGGRRSKSRENLNTSIGSSKSFRMDGGSPDTRDRDRYGEASNSSQLQKKDRAGSYSSLSSRGRHTPDSSYNDRESPVPSLPRPRRHDYPERERRERRRSDGSDMKKTPDGLKASTSSLATDSGCASLYSPKRRFKGSNAGSTTSLQDSGISEHEGGATGTSGPNSPLSKLPGPGKFKQMTGRREADTDSGFIGSMVGSEVSAGNLSSRRQPPQSPLRLRHPGDQPGSQQRPSSRQSTRSDDSTQVITPRSTRSVASSKSSRRTPTKAFPLPETSQVKSAATEARAKTPTRPDSRSKNRNQASHARDYTDESYTTVTESEMSFESDMQPRRNRPSSRNTSQRPIEKIAEDSEEEQYTVDPSLNETTDLNLSWISHSSRSERPTISESQKKDRVSSSASKTQQKQQQPSPRSKVKQPVDSQRSSGQAKKQGQTKGHLGRSSRSSRQMMSGDESSLTVSPSRDTTREITQDTTEDTYTSDETTPRSVIERERKAARERNSPRVTELKPRKSPSPSPETAPPRPVTPLKVQRSEVHPKMLYQSPQRGPSIQASESQRSGQDVYVSKEVGSGSEDTILASDAETAATRGSINSQRIKLLTDEIGKLKEEFFKANKEKQQQAPPAPVPPPAQPPQGNQYYDQYFDPTEHPLAFMRGPRRRANSFSGHGERQYEYDWMYPNNGDGDIPLGYAAAESYATPRKPHHKSEEQDIPTESRSRRRLRQRISQRNAGTQHFTEQNGYDSDQSPTRLQTDERAPQSARLQGHYGYYSPQNVDQEAMRSQAPTIQPPGYQARQSGKRVFGSQPNLTYTGYQPPPQNTATRSTASVASTRSSSGNQSQSRRPLRQTLYSYAANPQRPHSVHGDFIPAQHLHGQPNYANDDIHINDGRTRFIPNGAASDVYTQSDLGANGNYGVYTDTCPMCGNSSYHSHGEYVFPPEDDRVPVGYLVQNGRGPNVRGRSRSTGRTPQVRHYSPDGRVRSRYFVRQFGGDESESAESEVEELPRVRSRSVGKRLKMRHGRKYRRVRGDDLENDAPVLKSTEVQTQVQENKPEEKGDNPEKTEKPNSAAAEADLNRSLRLCGEIDDLTNKMMDTVGNELKSQRRKEFGSSVW